MPDIKGTLRRAASKYRSINYGQDSYGHIRVTPEHVLHTAVTAPHGNMVSLVVQQGAVNLPGTHELSV